MTGLAKLSTHRPWLLGAVATLGLLVTALTWHTVHTAEEERISSTFRRRAETQMHLTRARLTNYKEMVHSLQSLFAFSDEVTRDEFDRACASLFSRHPGVQALQWIELVTPETLPDFLSGARQEYPEFTPFERTPGGTTRPLGERAEYKIIRLISPLAGNERALGYDAATAPTSGVLELARRERRLAVSQPFRLIQATSPDYEHGVVFALPVFAGGDGAFRGYVQAVFLVETMIAQSHRSRPDEALLLHYTDRDAPADFATLYVNHAGREIRPQLHRPEPDQARLLSETEQFTVGGRRWEMVARINPEWQSAQRTLTPPLVFAGGLVTTCLALLTLNLLFRRAGEIETQVALRTAELERTKRELEDDIRQRQAAERALQSSEERLQAILDYSPALIFIKDLEGRYLLCNRQYERDLGRPRSEIIGCTDYEIFPEAVAKKFIEHDQAVLTADAPMEFEETAVLPDGPTTLLVQKFLLRDAQGVTYALCGIGTDITERLRTAREKQQLERRLQDKQKLESLGVLAGGIAHDFNNILTAVLANASLVRTLLPPDAKVVPQLRQIEHAARRAADLCTQMLAYAGKGSLAPGRLDLTHLVQDTLTLLEASVSKSTRLHRRLALGLPAVHADATQLRQIVMNLVINAAEAIGERSGDITLTTYQVRMSAEELHAAVQHPELPAGDYVALEVRDTGAGMSPETLTRIFEPFFTTKFSGRGLGLSAVLGIVRSHHGALFVESTPGLGTTFRLLLPAQDGTVTPPARPDAAASAQTTRRLRGTVLIVDDELTVREVTGMALQSAGLNVLEARDGHEALQLWRDRAADIRLILLDLTMPGLSGEETLRRLRMQGVVPKVVLMSGYSENEATRRCLQLGAVAFIQKPFELEQLLTLVETHLA